MGNSKQLEEKGKSRVRGEMGELGERKSGAGRIEAWVWCGRVDKMTKIKANEVLKCCEMTIVEPPAKQLECFISPFQELGRDGLLLSSPGRGGNGEE